MKTGVRSSQGLVPHAPSVANKTVKFSRQRVTELKTAGEVVRFLKHRAIEAALSREARAAKKMAVASLKQADADIRKAFGCFGKGETLEGNAALSAVSSHLAYIARSRVETQKLAQKESTEAQQKLIKKLCASRLGDLIPKLTDAELNAAHKISLKSKDAALNVVIKEIKEGAFKEICERAGRQIATVSVVSSALDPKVERAAPQSAVLKTAGSLDQSRAMVAQATAPAITSMSIDELRRLATAVETLRAQAPDAPNLDSIGPLVEVRVRLADLRDKAMKQPDVGKMLETLVEAVEVSAIANGDWGLNLDADTTDLVRFCADRLTKAKTAALVDAEMSMDLLEFAFPSDLRIAQSRIVIKAELVNRALRVMHRKHGLELRDIDKGNLHKIKKATLLKLERRAATLCDLADRYSDQKNAIGIAEFKTGIQALQNQAAAAIQLFGTKPAKVVQPASQPDLPVSPTGAKRASPHTTPRLIDALDEEPDANDGAVDDARSGVPAGLKLSNEEAGHLFERLNALTW